LVLWIDLEGVIQTVDYLFWLVNNPGHQQPGLLIARILQDGGTRQLASVDALTALEGLLGGLQEVAAHG
jgi:hypothetical protein